MITDDNVMKITNCACSDRMEFVRCEGDVIFPVFECVFSGYALSLVLNLFSLKHRGMRSRDLNWSLDDPFRGLFKPTNRSKFVCCIRFFNHWNLYAKDLLLPPLDAHQPHLNGFRIFALEATACTVTSASFLRSPHLHPALMDSPYFLYPL